MEHVQGAGGSDDGGDRANVLVSEPAVDESGSDEPDETRPGEPAGAGDGPSSRRSGWLLFCGLLLLLSVPMFVALGVLHNPRWFPLLDMAQTELRVRDVWSSHPPLIGLAGRIGPYGTDGGSHPGPLSFYALWPFYQAFGGSSWALQAAGVALNVIAMGVALWIARRRGGTTMLLAVAVALALLTHAYGVALLTLPWNPYLPVLWWFVFLLAVWSVLLDDLPMLPVAAFAGMFCLQTHIPYLGLVVGLGALAFAAVVRSARRHRQDHEFRRSLRRAGVAALAILVVTSLPPVIDEIVHEPGNLTTIRDHFSDPPEPPVGIGTGVRVMLTQLNPWTMVSETLVTDYQPHGIGGSTLPGLALLGVWAVSVVVAWRMRHRALLALDLVLASALVLGALSAARIFGYVWYYLLLSAWSTTVLLVLASGWTAIAYASRRQEQRTTGPADARDPARRERATVAGRVLLGGAVVVIAVVFTVAAVDVDVQAPRQNATLARLVEPTAEALAARVERADDRPNVVTFLPDPLGIGAQGFGLLNELDRRGFDVRVHPVFRPGATRYRVIDPNDAGLEIHLAIGPDIARWQNDPRYEQVAAFDPRADAEIADVERMRAEVIDDLARAGRPDLIDVVDGNLFMLGLDQDVPAATRDRIAAMLDAGLPAAVFIGPPSGEA